jgi:hypothetical protein
MVIDRIVIFAHVLAWIGDRYAFIREGGAAFPFCQQGECRRIVPRKPLGVLGDRNYTGRSEELVGGNPSRQAEIVPQPTTSRTWSKISRSVLLIATTNPRCLFR